MAKTNNNKDNKGVGRCKYERIVDIVLVLEDKRPISIYQLADKYNVNKRTIQRDIADVRAYYYNSYSGKDVVYDKETDQYWLKIGICA